MSTRVRAHHMRTRATHAGNCSSSTSSALHWGPGPADGLPVTNGPAGAVEPGELCRIDEQPLAEQLRCRHDPPFDVLRSSAPTSAPRVPPRHTPNAMNGAQYCGCANGVHGL